MPIEEADFQNSVHVNTEVLNQSLPANCDTSPIVLKFINNAGENQALLFVDAIDSIVVYDTEAVSPALQKMDQCRRQGLHVAGYLTYEASHAFHDISASEKSQAPILCFGVYEKYSLLDSAHALAWLKQNSKDRYNQLNFTLAKNGQQSNPAFDFKTRMALAKKGLFALDQEYKRFVKALALIHQELHAGNSYQINYTHQTEFDFDGNPLLLFNYLYKQQPTSQAALVLYDKQALLSFSPESFVEVRENANQQNGTREFQNLDTPGSNHKKYIIEARPMKGTAARSQDKARDQQQKESLARDPKNLAENLMILDLMRNDLGHHAVIGSVTVPEQFILESHPSLHQMTSRIQAELKQYSWHNFFASMLPDIFPSGSITGAPKLSSMQIIDNLETSERGPYTGSIGYALGLEVEQSAADTGSTGQKYNEKQMNDKLSRSRQEIVNSIPLLSLNIAIRTFSIDMLKEKARYGAGCGIVYDSKPEAEWQEYLLKQTFYKSALSDFHLIETMRLVNGKILLKPLHLQRLEKSVKYFHLIPDSLFANWQLKVDRKLSQCIADHPAGIFKIRLCVTAHQIYLGIQELPEPFQQPLFKLPNLALLPTNSSANYRLLLANRPVYSGNIFQHHKSSERIVYDTLFGQAKQLGYDDVLFLNEQGEVVESAIANILYLDLQETWHTPAPVCGALAGVLLESLQQKHNRINYDAFGLNKLLAANRIFTCNAVAGLRQVTEIYQADGKILYQK